MYIVCDIFYIEMYVSISDPIYIPIILYRLKKIIC